MNVCRGKYSKTVPTHHTQIPIPPLPQPPLTILQVYKNVFNVMRFFGSSNFKVTVQNKSDPNSPIPTLQFRPSKNKFILFKYFSTKFALTCHLLFFLSRFISMIFCNNNPYCIEKGVLLLAIGCYIQETMMVLGIYSWTHWKKHEISNFFERFNQVDFVVFDGGEL